MPNTITALACNPTRRKVIRRFKVTLSGSYVQAAGAAGEILDLTTILNPNFYGGVQPGFNPPPAPQDFSISRGPGGYPCEVVQTTGTLPSTMFALKFFSAVGTELAAGAYPAPITADPLTLELTATTFGG